MSWSRHTAVQAGALLAVGAIGGAVLAATVGASASSSPSPTNPAATYARGGAPGHGFGGPGRAHGLPLSGTVSSVGSDSVTITVNGAAKTYAVDANSDIDKNGEAKLSDLKSGDAVRFAVRPDGKTIAVLHAGDEAKDMPAGGPRFGAPGGPGRAHGLPLSGTVSSVGSDSVTITVNGAAKTYAVDANSDIDKNGESKLSDLKSGDAVRFAVRPDGKTIAVLHAGDEAKDMPAGGFMRRRPGPGGYGAPATNS